MLERRELDERIAEIRNKRNQTETECVKLAAFLIIRNEIDNESAVGSYGDAAPNPTAAPMVETVIGDYGDTDFLQMIAGMEAAHVWSVMAEAMESLKVMEPRLYAGILRKLNQ